jgi:hypothetical protein
MRKERIQNEEKATKPRNPESKEQQPTGSMADVPALTGLQRLIGNRAVQRLLAQRAAHEPAELDDETADRIKRERGGGQPLEESAQAHIGKATGHDFSGVRVHTSPDADALSRQLGAKAFTTGQDVFFREGAYEPHSTAGQELIAHELTHVVQQGSGAVSGGARMTVNAPGDAYEHEADATAKAIVGADAGSQAQRQVEEEEEPVQMQTAETVQRQEEEEELQMQIEEEEEAVQMQPEEEEEELQA